MPGAFSFVKAGSQEFQQPQDLVAVLGTLPNSLLNLVRCHQIHLIQQFLDCARENLPCHYPGRGIRQSGSEQAILRRMIMQPILEDSAIR